MAAIAPITIDDGKATPVAHTFNPIASVPASYNENGDSSVAAVGESQVVATLRRTNGQGTSTINRAKISLRIPVLETTVASSGTGYEAPPKIAYFMQATVECLLPERSTGDQRKDLRVLLTNLLSNAQVVSLVDSLETPY